MKEFDYTFKGLANGLRPHKAIPRNSHALVECHNIIPVEHGLDAYEPITDLGAEDIEWGGDGVYVRPPEVRDIIIHANDYLDNDDIAGATVLIDGIEKGVTDEEGDLFISNLAVGGHTIQIIAAGYISTSIDTLQNDYFTVV